VASETVCTFLTFFNVFLSCFTSFLERYASPTGRAKVSMVKYMDIAVRSLACHTATGTHVPCRITRCYLSPYRGDIHAFTPAEAGTRLSDPGGMQGWVDKFFYEKKQQRSQCVLHSKQTTGWLTNQPQIILWATLLLYSSYVALRNIATAIML